MRQLLAHRNARLYLSGQVMSLLGDGALWLAMGIWIKVLTGSSSAAGLSFFALALGSLCGPLGGLLADKVRRRPLLIVTNLATAGLVLLLLLVRDRDQVWLIYAVMFGYGVSGSVLGPAQTALLQAIVPARLLGDANSALQTAQQGLRLVTPLAGAGLFAAFGPAPVIIGDAATFGVAVVTLVAITISENRPGAGAAALARRADRGRPPHRPHRYPAPADHRGRRGGQRVRSFRDGAVRRRQPGTAQAGRVPGDPDFGSGRRRRGGGPGRRAADAAAHRGPAGRPGHDQRGGGLPAADPRRSCRPCWPEARCWAPACPGSSSA